MVYVATLIGFDKGSGMTIYLFRAAQVASLLADKAPAQVSTKYFDYADVFFPKTTKELAEHTDINDHAINLENGKQPSHGPIYSLGPVELEILKPYIETNLKSEFFGLPSLPLELPSSLLGSLTAASAFLSILKVLIT